MDYPMGCITRWKRKENSHVDGFFDDFLAASDLACVGGDGAGYGRDIAVDGVLLADLLRQHVLR